MANNIYPFSSLTGGVDDSYLDFFDGDDLTDGDFAFGIVSGKHHAYILDATSGASENSPYVVSPDTNPGTKRWILVSLVQPFSNVFATRATALSIPNNEQTTMVYTTEVDDDLGEYDNTTGIFTATYTGGYRFFAMTTFAPIVWPLSKYANTQVVINDTTTYDGFLHQSTANVSQFGKTFVDRTLKLSATNTARIKLIHDYGSAIDTWDNGSFNYLNITRVF
jgi:hypothetical protein